MRPVCIDADWLQTALIVDVRDLIGLQSIGSSWLFVQHAQRLHEAYGFDRALSILQGMDPATNADLEAWRRLGRREMAA